MPYVILPPSLLHQTYPPSVSNQPLRCIQAGHRVSVPLPHESLSWSFAYGGLFCRLMGMAVIVT